MPCSPTPSNSPGLATSLLSHPPTHRAHLPQGLAHAIPCACNAVPLGLSAQVRPVLLLKSSEMPFSATLPGLGLILHPHLRVLLPQHWDHLVSIFLAYWSLPQVSACPRGQGACLSCSLLLQHAWHKVGVQQVGGWATARRREAGWTEEAEGLHQRRSASAAAGRRPRASPRVSPVTWLPHAGRLGWGETAAPRAWAPNCCTRPVHLLLL